MASGICSGFGSRMPGNHGNHAQFEGAVLVLLAVTPISIWIHRKMSYLKILSGKYIKGVNAP